MTRIDRPTIAELRRLFTRNGYVRRPNTRRLKAEGAQSYKKGAEVRLVANSTTELARIRALLRKAGFRPGQAFAKGRQFRQPIYGHEPVTRFLALVSRKRPA